MIRRYRNASRALCPACGVVKPITAIHQDGGFTLQCSHVRPVILPKRRGSLSIEDADTAEGMRVFPLRWDEERSTSVHFWERTL